MFREVFKLSVNSGSVFFLETIGRECVCVHSCVCLCMCVFVLLQKSSLSSSDGNNSNHASLRRVKITLVLQTEHFSAHRALSIRNTVSPLPLPPPRLLLILSIHIYSPLLSLYAKFETILFCLLFFQLTFWYSIKSRFTVNFSVHSLSESHCSATQI